MEGFLGYNPGLYVKGNSEKSILMSLLVLYFIITKYYISSSYGDSILYRIVVPCVQSSILFQERFLAASLSTGVNPLLKGITLSRCMNKP